MIYSTYKYGMIVSIVGMSSWLEEKGSWRDVLEHAKLTNLGHLQGGG